LIFKEQRTVSIRLLIAKYHGGAEMSYKILRILFFAMAIVFSACTAQQDGVGGETPSGIEYKRDVANVDFEATEIIVMESHPMQVEIVIQGDLPTPCHQLRWEVMDPNENNAIHIQVYSEIDTSLNCAQLLEAFQERIPLGDFEESGYSVWINNDEVGGF
jgi:hypothetical protein